MKKFYSLLAVVALTATVTAQTEVVKDTFTYTGLLTANGWTKHSGTAGQLAANGNSVNLVAGDSEDVNKAFSANYTITPSVANKVEYSAQINVAAATGLSTSGEYFMHLSNQTGTSVSNFYGRLFIKGSATGYTLGIANFSNTATYTATEIPYGTPANIKVSFSVSGTTSTSSLIVDSQVSVSASSSNVPADLKSIGIRQAGNATSGTGNVSVGNLVVLTYAPETLAVADATKGKANLVKNTIVANELIFGTAGKVSVVNMNGQVVKTAEVAENFRLDVSNLVKGTYVVTGVVNGQAVSQKIIKK